MGTSGVAIAHLDRHARGDQVRLDQAAVRPGPGQQHHQLGRVHAGPVEHVEAGHLAQPLAGRGQAAQQPAAQPLTVAGQQRPGGVDAGQDRPGRAGGVGGVERALQPGPVQPLGPGQHHRALGVGGQRLVRAGHQAVRARRDGVGRQVRMEAEIGGPGLVDDQRHPGLVRGPGVAGQVAGGADVGRVAQDHAAGVRVRGQRVPDRLHRHRGGQAGVRVDVRPDPHRPQARQHHAEQQRPVQRPGDDHFLARLAHGQAESLVAVGRSGHREPAPVRAPQRGRARLGVGPQPVGVLDGVQRAVERGVARHHRAHQVVALLVARRAHRQQPSRFGLLHPVQPGGQQRGVRRQAEGVPRVSRVHDHLSSVGHATRGTRPGRAYARLLRRRTRTEPTSTAPAAAAARGQRRRTVSPWAS